MVPDVRDSLIMPEEAMSQKTRIPLSQINCFLASTQFLEPSFSNLIVVAKTVWEGLYIDRNGSTNQEPKYEVQLIITW
jgi:hypothetical protein